MKNTYTAPISEEYIDQIASFDIGKVAALIRRACVYAQQDAAQDGRIPPSWSITAWPYAEALSTLTSLREMYFTDPAIHLLTYLQNNLIGWRTPISRACKARLQALYKEAEAMQKAGELFTEYNKREPM